MRNGLRQRHFHQLQAQRTQQTLQCRETDLGTQHHEENPAAFIGMQLATDLTLGMSAKHGQATGDQRGQVARQRSPYLLLFLLLGQ